VDTNIADWVAGLTLEELVMDQKSSDQKVTDHELQHKAVAYAVLHKDEMPESVKKFIEDLYEYEETGKRLQGVHNQTRNTLKKIEEQMTQLYGSMEAIIKVIARELGPEKISEFGNKYKLPDMASEEKENVSE
jgi:hypothetical protein